MALRAIKSMANKRQRFETSDVIKMLDSSAEDPMMCGSDDEFDDFDEEDTDPSDDERIPLPSPLDDTSTISPSSSSLLLSDTDCIPVSPPPLPPTSSSASYISNIYKYNKYLYTNIFNYLC